jgi:hypothetical protein
MGYCKPIIILSLLLVSCGDKKPSSKDSGPRRGKAENAFIKAAKAHKVPARFLMGVGYLESGLIAKEASANYPNLQNDVDRLKGTVLTETAFGIQKETLGLTPDDERSELLEVQIDAYAQWLQTKTQGFNLTAGPRSQDEYYFWLWAMADLHRAGQLGRRHTQVVFASELMNILNTGFLWQDPVNGELLVLGPNKPSLEVGLFPEDGQKWFAANDPYFGQIQHLAVFVPLSSSQPGDLVNQPQRIEVIHCPLSLSACMELNSRPKDSDIFLGAHYLIPQDRQIFNKVVQVAYHNEVVRLTNTEGEPLDVRDAVVIMLVGPSGRIVSGVRKPVRPTWFSDKQLRALGQVVTEVCSRLNHDDPTNVQLAECMSIGGKKGVQFRKQNSEEFRWGDIADFDTDIFKAYLSNPSGLDAEMAFQFKGNRKTFRRGQGIPLTVLFHPNTQTVELAKMVRCLNGRTIWEVIRKQQVRGEKKVSFTERFYDSGPNANGDQFFRAKALDQSGRLLGWAIDQVHLSDFEDTETFGNQGQCGV